LEANEGEGGSWDGEQRLSIGRMPGCDVVLNDGSISRRHAEVVYTDGGWIVRDLASTNGTFLNGVRIGKMPQRLRAGDRLQPGKVVLTVKAIEEPSTSDCCVLDERLLHDPNAAGQSCALGTAEMPAFDADALPDPVSTSMPRRRPEPSLGADPVRDFLTTSLRGAVEALGAGGGAVFLVDANARRLVLKATHGAAAVERAAMYDNRLVQRCFQQDTSFLGISGSSSGLPRDSARSLLCVPLRPAQRLSGVLGFDRPAVQPFSERDQLVAEAIAGTMSAGIASAQQLVERQHGLFIQTLLALAQAVDSRDPFSAGHTQRVTEYTLMLAEELQVSAAEYQHLQMGTPLHDIGKIAVSEAILRKPGRLTPAEFAEVKSHPTRGVALLQDIPELDAILPIVGSHHEHWDGSGYPDGLIGEIIPNLARIVTVADVFDALSSDRPYRKALTVAEAFAYLQRNSGTLFDPQCAQAFVRIRSRVEKAIHDRVGMQPTINKRELDTLRESLRDVAIPRPVRPG
jgi:HD-GYP domain-containing protein (c-di-GMP phosphodiesterase class II)